MMTITRPRKTSMEARRAAWAGAGGLDSVRVSPGELTAVTTRHRWRHGSVGHSSKDRRGRERAGMSPEGQQIAKLDLTEIAGCEVAASCNRKRDLTDKSPWLDGTLMKNPHLWQLRPEVGHPVHLVWSKVGRYGELTRSACRRCH